MPLFARELPTPSDPVYAFKVGGLYLAAKMLVEYVKLYGDDPMKGMAGRVDSVLIDFENYIPPISRRTNDLPSE